MARGYPGAFGRKVNAPYVWIPLCVLFVAPFVDPRRPFRLLHLDLLVLLGFSVSLAFFNHGADRRLGAARLPAAGLPARAHAVRGLSGRRADTAEPLRLLVPTTWLAVGLVFLLGFRIGLNVTNSNVIDVGYAGVIGADRLADGKPLYGDFPKDNEHGDTYGPVNYYAYVPFEQALPWSGRWDDLPAAHGAAIVFDLLDVLLLWLLGRRIRGPTLGVALAYAWAAYPFTLFVAELELQRRARRRARARGDPGRRRPGAPRRARRAGRADEVRAARARAAAGHLPRRRRRGRLARALALFALAFAVAAAVLVAWPPCCTAALRRSTTARSATRPAAARRSRSGGSTAGSAASARVQVARGRCSRWRRVRAAPPRRSSRWPRSRPRC